MMVKKSFQGLEQLNIVPRNSPRNRSRNNPMLSIL